MEMIRAKKEATDKGEDILEDLSDGLRGPMVAPWFNQFIYVSFIHGSEPVGPIHVFKDYVNCLWLHSLFETTVIKTEK